MEKIWLKYAPKDISDEIVLNDNETLLSMFNEKLEEFPNKKIEECLGYALTYNEVDKIADSFAKFLQDECDIKKGDRIGVMLPNVLQYHIICFASFKIGAVVVGINPMYTEKELCNQFKDADFKVLVSLDIFAHEIAKTLKNDNVNINKVVITKTGDINTAIKGLLINYVIEKVKKLVKPYDIKNSVQMKNVLKKYKNKKPNLVEITGNDLAFLQYTGGTTGEPKGVMLSHKNIVANLKQIKNRTKPIVSENDNWLLCLPLFHIFALTSSLVPILIYGSKVLYVPNPRDFKSFIKILKAKDYSVLTGVNTLFNALCSNDDFKSGSYENLKLVWAGGMPVQDHVANKWKKITGTTMQVAYGLSETSPGVAADYYNQKDFINSIGYPFPATDIKIIDIDSGKEVKIGEKGELCVKGPQVMQGYWRNKEETNKAITNGWFHTGDIVTMDETGRIKIVDRVKDIVIVSGFNVYSVEVEQAIASINEVSDVAVVGLPSVKTGEQLKAYIILKKGKSLSKEQVRDHCHKNLTRYKVPKLIDFVEAFPLSQVGKILKKELRNLPENKKYYDEVANQNK